MQFASLFSFLCGGILSLATKHWWWNKQNTHTQRERERKTPKTQHTHNKHNTTHPHLKAPPKEMPICTLTTKNTHKTTHTQTEKTPTFELAAINARSLLFNMVHIHCPLSSRWSHVSFKTKKHCLNKNATENWGSHSAFPYLLISSIHCRHSFLKQFYILFLFQSKQNNQHSAMQQKVNKPHGLSLPFFMLFLMLLSNFTISHGVPPQVLARSIYAGQGE
jgi:hypothetical protein